jgi:hypothetical protein
MVKLVLLVSALALLPIAVAVAIWLGTILVPLAGIFGVVLFLTLLPNDARVAISLGAGALTLIWWFGSSMVQYVGHRRRGARDLRDGGHP